MRHASFFAISLAALAADSLAAPAPLARDFSLFGDHKSRQVDDVVTVMVGEANTAKNTAQTRTQSQSKGEVGVAGGTGVLSFVPGAGFKGGLGSDFQGQGNTVREGSMQAVVSARVVEVLPNGTLRIEGAKQVVINEETEVLTVAGLVRPEDIGADNTVPSGRLADAKISYAGHGATANAEKPGYFARFLDWLF